MSEGREKRRELLGMVNTSCRRRCDDETPGRKKERKKEGHAVSGKVKSG